MDFLQVSEPSLTEEDADAVARCVMDGWISSEGPQVVDFESRFAALVGRAYGVAVANGTAALDIAFEAIEIGPGDEVIVPSFTIISCLNHILRRGATPIFVDSLPDTWNMDPQAVEMAITMNTKAIVVVHIYGLPADIDQILDVADRNGILVVEDAAEAHGQHLEGRALGSFGKLSTFSFYSNKLITTGEGGMVLTDDPGLATRLRELRNLGFSPERRFVHHNLGWNYRMTAMQAALGLSQLNRIEALLAHKKQVGAQYQALLSGASGVQLPLPSYRGSNNVYWVFGVVLHSSYSDDARGIMQRLAEEGIGTRPFFYPLHRQPVLRQFGLERQLALPVSENLGERGFYIPSGANITLSECERVAQTLIDVLSN